MSDIPASSMPSILIVTSFSAVPSLEWKQVPFSPFTSSSWRWPWKHIYCWLKDNLHRSNAHPKFDPTKVRTHDLQIMTVQAYSMHLKKPNSAKLAMQMSEKEGEPEPVWNQASSFFIGTRILWIACVVRLSLIFFSP